MYTNANQIVNQTVREKKITQYREQIRTYTITTDVVFRLRQHKHEIEFELQHETSDYFYRQDVVPHFVKFGVFSYFL